MSEAFVGQISTYGFDFPPKYWAYCNGQTLPINQNLALFSLLGIQFGGNGTTTFALPNLQTRAPLHAAGLNVGLRGGEVFHTLAVSELPAHTHMVRASGATSVTAAPSPNSRLGVARPGNLYGPPGATKPMAGPMIGPAGGSQPHENRQPYLALNFSICLFGVFPTRN